MSKPLAPNTITYAMEMGRALRVRVIGLRTPDDGSWMGAAYNVEYVDDEKVCLDFGQNWYAEKGMKFVAYQVHIDTAARLRAEWAAK